MNKIRSIEKKDLAAVGFVCLCAFFIVFAPVTPRPFSFWPFVFGLVGYVAVSPKPALDKNLLIFLGTTLLLSFSSTLWSVNPGESAERAAKIAALFTGGVLLLAFAQSLKPEQYKKYLWLLPVATFVSLIILTAERSFHYPIYLFLRPEAQGAAEYVTNKACGIVILTFWPSFYLAYKLYPYKGAVALMLAAAALLLFSESQSSQLSFLVLLLFGFLFPYRFKSAWIALGALMAIGMFILPWCVHYAYINYADALWKEGILMQSSASMRLEIWDFVSKKIFESPLYGHGMEAARFIEDFDSQKRFHPTNLVMHPHGATFQLWLEFGVVGALLGVSFVLYLLKLIYNAPIEKQRLLLPAYMGILCVAMIGWGMWQSWWIGLLFVAAAVCLLAAKTIDPYHHEAEGGSSKRA